MNIGPRITILEVRTGDEKLRDENGYRKDSVPIADALTKLGFEVGIQFYSEENAEALFQDLLKCVGVISRVNPGNIPEGEAHYLKFLDSLEERGVKVFTSAKTMINYGSKSCLYKLRGTSIVPSDIGYYNNVDELRANFPAFLKTGQRVLKSNRGSQGSGIWLVKLEDPNTEATSLDEIKVICTEAVDNHEERHTLADFINFCSKYFDDTETGIMVDMRFLPRIVEGEIRILLIGQEPIFVIHKKPQDGSFSSTLGSGAEYKYQDPSEWPELLKTFYASYELLNERLGSVSYPLIWTADFILDTAENGSDAYILSELNCSCVGFTSLPNKDVIAEKIALEVQRNVKQ